MEKKNIKCVVCESSSLSLKYRRWSGESDPLKLYGSDSGIKGTQDIVRCNKCNLVFESPRYDDSIIYMGYKKASGDSHDSQYIMRVKNYSNILKKLQKYLPNQTKKLLDIGTAGGAFLEAANNFGYNSIGLEPSEDMVHKAQNRGLNVYQGTLEQNSFKKGSFDMVTMWDVLEHLPNPVYGLSKVHNLLNANGILIINYPNCGSYIEKILGQNFWWYMSLHLYYFDRKTIEIVCRKANFKVIAQLPYSQILELGYLVDMAAKQNFPFANWISGLMPNFIKKIKIKYYAAQVTLIARKL
jgi:2-polyprenyl-3-methyl-5-hydroxy-6-metoxy-1,4-benzoquinol methylase